MIGFNAHASYVSQKEGSPIRLKRLGFRMKKGVVALIDFRQSFRGLKTTDKSPPDAAAYLNFRIAVFLCTNGFSKVIAA